MDPEKRIKLNASFEDDQKFKDIAKALRFGPQRSIIMKSIRQASRIAVIAQRKGLKASRKRKSSGGRYGYNKLSKSLGVVTKRQALWVKVGARISAKHFGFAGRWVSEGLDTSDRKKDNGASTGNMGSGSDFISKAWSSTESQVKATLGSGLASNLDKYIKKNLK